MGVRQRKNHLLNVLLAHVKGGQLAEDQALVFESMYRRCRTTEEQDAVTAAVHVQIDGWKSETDRHSRVLRDVFDVTPRFEEEQDEEDPPALKAALARSQVSFVRR